MVISSYKIFFMQEFLHLMGILNFKKNIFCSFSGKY